MICENDYVCVNWDFGTEGDNHYGYLKNGILELKGNFEQLGTVTSNFSATENHKVIFSGDTLSDGLIWQKLKLALWVY